MAFTVDDLINSIKLRSFAPISQSTFQDADLLSLANEELGIKLVSDLIQVREDFFLETESTPVVANIDHYTVPERSIGNALKAVYYQDASGNTFLLQRIDNVSGNDYQVINGFPAKYYFQGDEIILVPRPSSSTGNLLFVFPGAPNQMVLGADALTITASSLGTYSVNADFTAQAGWAVGSKCDIISAKAPFKAWVRNISITNLFTSSIEFASTDVDDENGNNLPQVGDYIALTGQSPVPQIPIAFHPVLAQMVNVRLMESLGDLNKMNAALATLNQLRTEALKLVKNRVESSPQRVNTKFGYLRYLS